MRPSPRSRRRPRRAAVALAGILAAVVFATGGCAPAAPAEGPAAAVDQALDRLAARDLDGLRALACAGQEDAVRERLGMAGSVGAELLGVDAEALLDAVGFDVSDIDIGEPAIEGDVAHVRVTGAVKVTFDEDTLRPILRRVLEEQGREAGDEQLDAVLRTLAAFGQELPVDESLRLVREGGAWKLCEEELEAPAAS